MSCPRVISCGPTGVKSTWRCQPIWFSKMVVESSLHLWQFMIARGNGLRIGKSAMTRKRKERNSDPMPEAVETPARIRPEHVQDRTLSVVAGAPKAFRTVDWLIQIAHEKGRLHAYPSDPDAEMRWQAIRAYDAYVSAINPSGRDSTDLDIVKGGSGFPITEAISDAVKKLVSIDSLMPRKDRTICRKLCEGYSLPGAVRAACGDDFVHTVAARVRDALDALIQAMHGAKRAGYTFDLRSL